MGEAKELWKTTVGSTQQSHNVTESHTAATDGGSFVCGPSAYQGPGPLSSHPSWSASFSPEVSSAAEPANPHVTQGDLELAHSLLTGEITGGCLTSKVCPYNCSEL